MHISFVNFGYHILLISSEIKDGDEIILKTDIMDTLSPIDDLLHSGYRIAENITSLQYRLCYYSCEENRYYFISASLSKDHFNKLKETDFSSLDIAIAPYGIVSLLAGGMKKKILVSIQKAVEINMNINPEYTKPYRKTYSKNENISKHMFEKYMQQFTYRYVVMFGLWEEKKDEWKEYGEDVVMPEFDYIEEALFDGTYDKLHDENLMKYHQAGKPKKLALKWHKGKAEYSAYFWFEDERIREVFDRFYGAHPETKTDFIIRIDAEQRKYELSLYRYGLKEPQVIPVDAYQLIVFKNKFEDYRSDNYNQSRGAWIW